jgi:predicted esterase
MTGKKPLLVWLHGFCYDNTRDAAFRGELANALDCRVLAVNAPHAGSRPRGGFMWHDVPVKHKAGITREFIANCLKQLKVSAAHIIAETEKELTRLGLSWQEVIIAGHSQGADMAARLALQNQPARCVISLCGQDPEYTIQKNIKFKTTPIIWVAGIGDCILPREYADCYRAYRDAGVRVEYLETECRVNGHDYPCESIIPEIVKKYREIKGDIK